MQNQMTSPWERGLGGFSPDRGDSIERQSHVLGNFIERSTSAPPISSEIAGLGRTRLGSGERSSNNFLFEPKQVDQGIRSNEVLFSQNGRESAPLAESDDGSAFLYSVMNDQNGNGRSSVSALDYGRATNPRIDSADPYSMGSVTRSSNGAMSVEPPLERSRSAAPSLLSHEALGAPPGLGSLPQHRDNNRHGFDSSISSHNEIIGERRSASTSYLPGGSINGSMGTNGIGSSALHSLSNGFDQTASGPAALRPAPKTPMDLIKESLPSSSSHDPHRGMMRSQTAVPYFDRDEVNGSGGSLFDRARSVSPGVSHNLGSILGGVTGPMSNDQRHPVLEPAPSFRRNDRFGDDLSREMGGMNLNGNGNRLVEQHTSLPLPQQQPQPQPQFVHGEISRPQAVPATSLHAPSHLGRPPQDPYDDRGYNNHAAPRHQQSMYAATAPQQQQPLPMYNSNRHMYNGQSQSHPPARPIEVQQQQSMQNVQILPNGQAMYIAAPAPYTYQPMQYHPHSQVMHPQVQRQQSDPQYISVVPVRTSNGEIAYIQQASADSLISPQVGIVQGSHKNPRVVRKHGLEPANDFVHRGGRGGNLGKNRPHGAGRGSGEDRRGRRTNGRRMESKTGAGSPTSPLLDEFRATKNREWTIFDIEGHVVEFCQDQNGSRFIQQRLELVNLREQDIVVREVLQASDQLRNDVFGNYVVQKLFEFGTAEVKAQLRDTLKDEMLALSLQMYGCRVVQKALETLEETDLPGLLDEFKQHVLSCIHDQNGNHVIQKCIEVMSIKAKQATAAEEKERAQFLNQQLDFIVNDVLDNVVSLSCHPYGCRVLQRILEHCIDKRKEEALNALSPCHQVLLDDCFGNYVIQHVICYGRGRDRDSILSIIAKAGLLSLSKQKFASNVIEKLLKYGSSQHRNLIAKEMLKKVGDASNDGDEKSSVVLLMVRDAYANYVVQTALDVVPDGKERTALYEELNAHSAQLRAYTFAKHIVTKLSS